MQDSPSSSALYHLKMAKSYLDEARDFDKDNKNASQYASESQIKILSKAATHLSKARGLDPTAVLPVEDKKDKTVINCSQDVLTALVLAQEGLVARVNQFERI
jgi:hypothetical protein